MSSNSIPSSPILSERLRANPSARAYLVRRAGQDVLVDLTEARQWFQHGYTIRDPTSREVVDIGAVEIPSYAEGEGAFVREQEAERRARDALAKSNKEQKNGNGSGIGRGVNGVNRDGNRNGSSGGAGSGMAT